MALDLNKLPTAAPNLYYALKALVEDAHYSQEKKSWSIGPMSDETMSRLWCARQALKSAESVEEPVAQIHNPLTGADYPVYPKVTGGWAK